MVAGQNNPISSNPMSNRQRRAVGVFSTRQAAEQALQELKDSGFTMDRVSVIARDADRKDEMAGVDVRDQTGNKADDGAKVGAVSGGALGGLTGLLVGLGTLAIPGIGPILLAGAGATVLATTAAGGAIGAVAGGLAGALIGLGIPEDRARVYSDRVSQGHYLVMLDGTDAEINRAESILHRRGIEEYGVYDAPDRTATATSTGTTTSAGATPLASGATSAVAAGTRPVTSGTGHGARQRAVGFFSNLRDVEGAISELKAAGFPVNQISVVAKNVQRHGLMADLDVQNRLDDRRYGLSTERSSFLQNRIDHGDYLLAIEGTEAEIRQASAILNQGSLNRPGIQEFNIYNTADWNRAPEAQPQVDRMAVPGTRTAQSGQSASTNLGAEKRAIGVFQHRREAETALTELRSNGFSMNQVSLIAKDTDQGNIAGATATSPKGIQDRTKADEGAVAGAATGGALGGLGGLLVGLGTLAIPGIGPIVAGGATATALATALTGGAIGAAAGGLTGGLVGLGIPEDQAKVYNDRFNQGDYLVMVEGTEAEVRRAETLLNRQGIRDWRIFDASNRTAHTNVSGAEDRRVNPDVRTNPDRTPDVIIDDRRKDTF